MRVCILVLLVIAGAILLESSPLVGTAEAVSATPPSGTEVCPPDGIYCPQAVQCLPTCWEWI
jgi:hypothetical protein